MNYKFKTDPYKHQITALEKSWNRETYAYFMEMGTGKSKVLVDNKIIGGLIITVTHKTSNQLTHVKYVRQLRWVTSML